MSELVFLEFSNSEEGGRPILVNLNEVSVIEGFESGSALTLKNGKFFYINESVEEIKQSMSMRL